MASVREELKTSAIYIVYKSEGESMAIENLIENVDSQILKLEQKVWMYHLMNYTICTKIMN